MRFGKVKLHWVRGWSQRTTSDWKCPASVTTAVSSHTEVRAHQEEVLRGTGFCHSFIKHLLGPAIPTYILEQMAWHLSSRTSAFQEALPCKTSKCCWTSVEEWHLKSRKSAPALKCASIASLHAMKIHTTVLDLQDLTCQTRRHMRKHYCVQLGLPTLH